VKIRPIKPGHTVNCTYCKAEGNKVQATWHLTMANIQSCDLHKPKLNERKDMLEALNDEPSEADQQTWMRL
jgi:hypothetical protein